MRTSWKFVVGQKIYFILIKKQKQKTNVQIEAVFRCAPLPAFDDYIHHNWRHLFNILVFYISYDFLYVFTIHHITILRRFCIVVILFICVYVSRSYFWRFKCIYENCKCVTERPNLHTYACIIIIAKNAHITWQKGVHTLTCTLYISYSMKRFLLSIIFLLWTHEASV